MLTLINIKKLVLFLGLSSLAKSYKKFFNKVLLKQNPRNFNKVFFNKLNNFLYLI